MRFLRFINLLDTDGRLSLTNIIVITVLVRFCLIQPLAWADALAFFLAILNYGLVRVLSYRESIEKMEWDAASLPNRDEINKVIARVEELGGKVSTLNLAMGLTKNK